jgi:hypothetical protein
MLVVAYATGRASHARQVKGNDPDKKGYPGPPGWGFGVGQTTPHSKKNLLLRKSNKGKRWWRELVTVKMEGYCLTGQSPQQVVVPMEKEEEEEDV